MPLFELVIGLLLLGAILAAGSTRFGLPYPALLALAGAGAAFIPGAPTITLDPGLALVLFVAPTLLDAAYDASPRDIRANWLPIGALAVVVVLLTVAAVAWVVHALVPAIPWAAAFALGAIVGPSDASAASAILRQLHLPHRLTVIIEGESLLNDAVSLLIYRLAVGAALGGAVGWTALPQLLLTVGGGALLGWVLAYAWRLVHLQQLDIPLAVLTQFLATFAVWIVADRLGVSAIITTVVYGMALARHVPLTSGARRRIASYAVWEVAVFVLNVLAFILIGLQLKAIVARIDGHAALYAATAAAVLATVILVRLTWAMAYNAILRWALARFGPRGNQRFIQPTAGGGFVIAWCGMRGIVTLATALALPGDFPQHDLLVFCAVAVVLGTLILQGLTLAPIMRHLDLPIDTSVPDETALARAATARAALEFLGTRPDDSRLLRKEYTARAERPPEDLERPNTLATLQRQAVTIQRRTLMDLRRQGTIGDDAFHVIEAELDVLELTADPRIRPL